MSKRLKKTFEYRIIISPDVRTGTGEHCFTAFVPMLGIATSGNTVEEAYRNVEELIAFHIESLRKEKQPIPIEQLGGGFITTARIAVPA